MFGYPSVQMIRRVFPFPHRIVYLKDKTVRQDKLVKYEKKKIENRYLKRDEDWLGKNNQKIRKI